MSGNFLSKKFRQRHGAKLQSKLQEKWIIVLIV